MIISAVFTSDLKDGVDVWSTIRSLPLMSPSMSLKDKVVRRRVDQLRALDQRRGLGEPRRIPERAHLALHLVARAGAAIVAVEGWSLQKECAHSGAFQIGVTDPSEPTRIAAAPPFDRPRHIARDKHAKLIRSRKGARPPSAPSFKPQSSPTMRSEVPPLSWTPKHLCFRSPQCRRNVPHTRLSSGGR